MLLPLNRMCPCVLATDNRSKAIPRVDLPEPDSPTMPSVSPRGSETSRLSTATNSFCLNHPLRMKKLQRTPLASNKGSAFGMASSTMRLAWLANKRCVYSSRGWPNKRLVSADSIRRPSCITPTRSAKLLTRFRSCVIIKTAMPSSRCN